MIVNRACSQGPENPDPAPSITATIKFNAGDLGLGNYVEIIDIADSVDYISYDSVLVFSDTAFVSSQGGLFTYSTEFDPGEGRLFKIVQTSEITMSGSINTNYTYQNSRSGSESVKDGEETQHLY